MKTVSPRNRHGVSVVGIMVAVAAIGIVVAMGVPAQMRDSAIRHERRCNENLARIEGAIVAHTLEKGAENIENQRLALNDLIRTTGTGFLETEPHCPSGGAYSALGSGTAHCTIHGTWELNANK